MTTASFAHAFIGDVVLSAAGSIGANTSVTVTGTIPTGIPTTAVPVATIGTTVQNGISVGHAWISGAGELSVKIVNSTSGSLTPTGDPLTAKVIIF